VGRGRRTCSPRLEATSGDGRWGLGLGGGGGHADMADEVVMAV